jgi:hypothetical protein
MDIKSPMSGMNGDRKIFRIGNVNQVNSWTLNLDNLAESFNNSGLYWSVQAIDHGYVGSEFAPEDTIDLSGKILQVIDVPNDQGGKVTIRWQASGLDINNSFLTYYSIWRALPAGSKSAPVIKDVRSLEAGNEELFIRKTNLKGSKTYWEWVANQPAHKMPVYAFTCPTVNDSMSGYDGMHEFMISAHTSDPNVYFDSESASGYSVDNLAPVTPIGLKAAIEDGSVLLTWSPNSDIDLKQYLVYRSEWYGIDPLAMDPYATTNEPAFRDDQLPGSNTYYYIVCAQDVHENVSQPSNEVSAILTGILNRGLTTPMEYALHPVYPNPFMDEAQIRFDLPEKVEVCLEVYTVVGEKVGTLLHQDLNTGSYTFSWKPARILPAGTYICVLKAGERSMVRRMMKER